MAISAGVLEAVLTMRDEMSPALKAAAAMVDQFDQVLARAQGTIQQRWIPTQEQAVKLSQQSVEVQNAVSAAMDKAAQTTGVWTDAQQKAAQAESALRDEASKMNEAFDKAHSSAGGFGEELMKMVGLGAAVGGGLAIASAAIGFLREATIGGIESFVAFGHGLDLIHTKLNVPVEIAAAWDQSASVTGVSAERITSSLAMMDQRLATGNKQAEVALHNLGINMEEIKNAAPEKQMELLSAAFQHLEGSGIKVDALFKELGGRGFLSMLPAFTKDAEDLRKKIEEINGPLDKQVEAAKRFEVATSLLSAQWEKVKRTLTEPLVGGLASFMERMNKASESGAGFQAALTQAALGAVGINATGATTPGKDYPLLALPPQIDPAAQAAADKARKAAEAEMADFTRRAIELEKEFDTALAGTTKGLDAEIEKIHANAVAKIEMIEADRKLTDAHKVALEGEVQQIEAAQVATAQDAAARASATETQKLYAEAATLSAKAVEAELSPLDASILKLQTERDKVVDAATAAVRMGDAELAAGNAVIVAANAARDAGIARLVETDATQRATDAAKTALAVDAVLAQAEGALAKAHHDKGDSIGFATQKALDHIAKMEIQIDADKKLTDEEKALLKARLDEAAGIVVEAGAQEKLNAQMEDASRKAAGTATVLGAVADAAQAFGVDMQGAFGKALTGLKEWAGGMAEAAHGFATGNVFEIISGSIHQIIGEFHFFKAVWDGLFGDAEWEKVNKLRQAYVDAAGGLDQLRLRAAAAGMTLTAFLDAKKVKAYEEAIKMLDLQMKFVEAQGGLAALKAHAEQAGISLQAMFDAKSAEALQLAIDGITKGLADWDEATKLVDEAMKKYGITIDQMGPKFSQQKLDEQAMQLYQDYKLLTAAGADHNLVLSKMAPSINEYVQSAIKAGDTIPLAMQPIIEEMIKNGLLLDANGKAYTSAEEAGIHFALSTSEALQLLIQKITDLVNALLGIPKNVNTNVNTNFTTSGDPTNPTDPSDRRFHQGNLREHGSAGGFHGMVSGPMRFLVGEAGPERVDVTPAGQAGAGTDMRPLLARLASIERLLTRQPTAIRDAVLKAR